MFRTIFYRLDPLLICLALFGLLIAAEVAGFRIGKTRTRPGAQNTAQSDMALILGAVLTMLSLLLGFTYAMSQSRFETRRQLVIDEANAIGTTFLRTQTLPEPRASELQELLRRYVALRAEAAGLKDDSPERIRDIDVRAKRLQDLMWSRATALAKESPSPVVAIFVQALNDTIDFHGKRMAAFKSRVPYSIYLVLFGISAVAIGMAGLYFASGGRRRRIMTTIFAFLVTAIMWLILDLDNPVRGSIKATQQSLIELQQDLGPPSHDRLMLND
jgi:hypothetical protein